MQPIAKMLDVSPDVQAGGVQPPFGSKAARLLFRSIGHATTQDQLDDINRAIWAGVSDGVISENDAALLTSFTTWEPAAPAAPKAAGATVAKFVKTIFKPRQRPRSPDRKASRDRRRLLGGASSLPPSLRSEFTEGQRAVLYVVADEVKRHGCCYCAVDAIAARAGVCRTTVQTTLHQAQTLGYLVVRQRRRLGRRNLTNVVTITSKDWVVWLKRRNSGPWPSGSRISKMVGPTERIDLSKREPVRGDRPLGALRREKVTAVAIYPTDPKFAVLLNHFESMGARFRTSLMREALRCGKPYYAEPNVLTAALAVVALMEASSFNRATPLTACADIIRGEASES